MSDRVRLTAFEAIQKTIKALGLRHFPCGIGSWHKIDLSKKRHQRYGSQVKDKYGNLQSTDIVETDKVNTEQLAELITCLHSPWCMDYSWSREAHSLRETAIKSPWLINPDFVYSYFRTLNMNDKAVMEIDEGLLRFKNLEELTLSANYITAVNSSYLPASLKVLELCANDIDDITDLCKRPPALLHLGLGRNRISHLGSCISGTFWPELVSLDLSYNDLCGLTDIVNTFSKLPKLRNLTLQGNPMSLVAGYRGYVIDFLRNLTVLDDRQISVDEKYNFHGLSALEGLVCDEAKVQLGVVSLKGLLCPPEIMHPESKPEYPVIQRSYFVQFMLPVVQKEPGEEIELQSVLTNRTSANELAVVSELDDNSQRFSAVQGQSEDVEQIDPEKDAVDKNPSMEKTEPVVDVLGKTSADVVSERLEVEEKPQIKVGPINSSSFPWDYDIHFGWTRDITLSDMLILRDFFKTGMDVHVMEETVEFYPPTIGLTRKLNSKEKDQKEKKKHKEPEKHEKQEKPEKSKERGKKKEDSTEELLKCPPTLKNIASFHVPLDGFLNGEFEYENKFTKIYVSSETSINTSQDKFPVIPENIKEKKGSFRSPTMKKEQRRPSVLEKGSDKNPNKRKQAIDEVAPPTELQLCLTMKLGHWMTALDAVTVGKIPSSVQIVNVSK
ncbi:hypothetical protein BsWGS_21575 [Bradybaena similaris]